MKFKPKQFQHLVSISVLIVLLPVALCASPPRRLANRLLEQSGVQGGLIVHVGCDDGTLTAALRANERFTVHGLALTAQSFEKARNTIRKASLYGKITVDRLNSDYLPFVDNMVNLLIAENPGDITLDEIMRVLCPQGVSLIKRGDQWIRTVKPRPADLDEWTHYWHGPDGNPVSHDQTIDHLKSLQWIGSPLWARHHDHMASTSALVSAKGRIFYIFDEGPTESIQLPSRWSLVARDAYNGCILWKRPISEWHNHLWSLKSGPAHLPRRLVAVGDRVFVTLGIKAAVCELNAATGETVRTYTKTASTSEILFSDGVLYLVVGNPEARPQEEYAPTFNYVWKNMNRTNKDWAWKETESKLKALDVATGETLWEKTVPVTPMTPALDQGRLYFHDGQKIVALNRKGGATLWESQPIARRKPIRTSYAPRLVVHKDVVLFSGGKRSIVALYADTGKQLWAEKQVPSGHNSPEDLMVTGGLVWYGATAQPEDSGVFTGRDLYTGEIKKQFPPDVETYWFHQRCYPSKATDRFLLPSRTGIEFVDIEKEQWTIHHWIRGGCIYGVMPANGLIYSPPHACGCYIEAILHGFSALAPASPHRHVLKPTPDNRRLQKGLAYGLIKNQKSKIKNEEDWPTYRHDSVRSGSCPTTVSSTLTQKWRQQLDGKLTSPVIAGDKVYIARIDNHTVYALDRNTGNIAWTYTAGGPVDSPPTIYHGRVLFGSADGWVYCLAASDGQLAWRYQAAPLDLRLMAFEKFESVWPVHGSVLIQNDVLTCVAGRSMFLDGGLTLLRLDPITGKKLSENKMDGNAPSIEQNLHSFIPSIRELPHKYDERGLTMPVALPDILSSDGRYLYMRSQRFDLKGRRLQIAPRDIKDQVGDGVHLFSTAGFLDSTQFHRSYWIYGKSILSGWPGWLQAGRYVPSGRLLVFDDEAVYGFGRRPEYWAQCSIFEYQLYAAHKQVTPEGIQRVFDKDKSLKFQDECDWTVRRKLPLNERTAAQFIWRQDQPGIQTQAMAKAADTLFVAGPVDIVDEEESFLKLSEAAVRKKMQEQRDILAGKQGAWLWAVSADNGEKQAEYKLDALPVWDGLAVARGCVFLSTKDGTIRCLTGE